MAKESTDLIVFEKLTPAVIFAPGGVNDILEKIAREVRSTPTDISTKPGRDAVASLAYKVARSKTALDKMGKELGEENFRAWKLITTERARIEKELDALRDEVRKPLTEWENAEKDRITGHEAAIMTIQEMGTMRDFQPTSESVKLRMVALSELPVRDWQEFGKRASEAMQSSLTALQQDLSLADTREAEAAELARLRAEQIAREQKERDDRIAAAAAEKARLEAEQKAAREADEIARAAEVERRRIEQEKAAAVARAEQAEAARIAAAARAEQDAKAAAEAAERRQLAAIDAERQRVADLAAADAAEAAKRNANTAHKSKINNAVMAALEQILPSKDLAKAVVTAIAKGEIPHTKIEY